MKCSIAQIFSLLLLHQVNTISYNKWSTANRSCFTAVQNVEHPCEVGTHGYDVLSFALKRFLRSVEFIFGCFSTFAVIYNLNLKFFGDRIVRDAISI